VFVGMSGEAKADYGAVFRTVLDQLLTVLAVESITADFEVATLNIYIYMLLIVLFLLNHCVYYYMTMQFLPVLPFLNHIIQLCFLVSFLSIDSYIYPKTIYNKTCYFAF